MTDSRIDRLDGAKVIWYQWAHDLTTEGSALGILGAKAFDVDKLSESREYDLSAFLTSFSYQKSKESAAGSFTLELAPAFDWAKFMKPGDWITVYLASDGTVRMPTQSKSSNLGNQTAGLSLGLPSLGTAARPKLPLPLANSEELADLPVRCILQVQRVGLKSQINADGTRILSYQISGKDLGVCLEELNLFLDASLVDAAAMKAFASTNFPGNTRNLSVFMDKWIDAFASPEKLYAGTLDPLGNSPGFFKQFLLPAKMLETLGIETSGGSFFGDLVDYKDIHPTEFQAGLSDPFAGLEGDCFAKLKELSDPAFHELFLEIDDEGQPKLTFRPIPWGKDQSQYPRLGKSISTYAQHAGLTKALPSLSGLLGTLTGKGATSTYAPVKLSSTEVYEFDLGSDNHTLHNVILADNAYGSAQLSTSMMRMTKPTNDLLNPWPFRIYSSIKRFGLKTLKVDLKNFITTGGETVGKISKQAPDRGFLIEAAKVQADYWFGATDHFSGTLQIAGRSDIRIGKCLLTDSELEGAADYVFYIEGYQDSVVIDENGTVSWVQTVNVVRGIEKADLISNLEGALQDRKGVTKLTDFVT